MFAFKDDLSAELSEIRDAGLHKDERQLTTAQSAHIATTAGQSLNFCANNYLGLADHPDVVGAARDALDRWGFGMASVRFICGTQTQHRDLEHAIADFSGTEDSILFASCFDANGGVLEVLFGAEDAIISDALNHASIIDGIRLSKAKRFRYANRDMDDLRGQLVAAREGGARRMIIVTDGVFSMDGYYAPLEHICDLADEFEAMVFVDDCHATGFVGEHGRGTAEHCGVLEGMSNRVDIITGTLGKALGGAMGGFTCAKQSVVDMLRQRSRPYLFSNSLAPGLVGASLKAIELAKQGDDLRKQLKANSEQFRKGMTEAGFTLPDGEHPIIPVMLGDANVAQDMAAKLLDEGIYVIGFFFPVVPKGEARIRTQMSAAHTPEQIDRTIAAFTKVGKELGVI